MKNLKFNKVLSFLVIAVICTLLIFCETKQTREEREAREASAKWGSRKGGLNLSPKKGSVEIPEFSTPEMQELAEDYVAYQAEIRAATNPGKPGSDDPAKVAAYRKTGIEWPKRSRALKSKMTPEDAQKLSALKTAIQGHTGDLKSLLKKN